MRDWRSIFLCVGAFFLTCCQGGSIKRPLFHIGVDPAWYPLDFEAFQPRVNGFMDEVFLEIAAYAGVEFVKIEANWDSLVPGLEAKRYDAALSALPAHLVHLAKYDFSPSFLPLGPMLIVPINAKTQDLGELSGEVVGVLTDDPAFLVVQKYPRIIVRRYVTAVEMLEALASGSIEGALLDRLEAMGFVRDLYRDQLKVVGEPLTDKAIRAISLSASSPRLMQILHQSLTSLEGQKKMQALREKWGL